MYVVKTDTIVSVITLAYGTSFRPSMYLSLPGWQKLGWTWYHNKNL